MLTVGDYIEINENHIRNFKRTIRLMERGDIEPEAILQRGFTLEGFARAIFILTKEIEYLRGFNEDHILTSAEVRELRAIQKELKKF